MGTRAVIAIDPYGNRQVYTLFYHHMDGYPTWLGLEIVKVLRKLQAEEKQIGRTFAPEEIENRLIKELKLENMHRAVGTPEEAFTKVEGDLEYIYAISDLKLDTISMQIFKTSNLHTERNFAWRIWGAYLKYMPTTKELSKQFGEIELSSGSMLSMLEAYEKSRMVKVEA